jgi:hypothetical protein
MKPGLIVAITCLVLFALLAKYQFIEKCGWKGALRGYEFIWLARGC